MRFNICTNLDNGVGLERDYQILRGLLESWGHQVHGVHYKKQNQIEESPNADINLFLEVLQYDVMKKSKRNWLIPNPEWFAVCDHRSGLPEIDKILCKTQDAVRIFTELYGPERVTHIGFESADNYDPTVERQRKFLHIAGQSRYKNSKGVAYAFAKFFDDASDKDINRELIFVGAYEEEVMFARDHKNVKYIRRASDGELKKLQNECLFHIMPSGYEGWGHALHEGFGVGAVTISTDYPPMNEFAGAPKELLIPYQEAKILSTVIPAKCAFVGAYQIKDFIDRAWRLTPERIKEIQENARAYFLKQREEFRTKFKSVVEAI